MLAVGARGRGVGSGLVYPVSKVAARHGASVERETTKPAEAYAKARAGLPRSRWVKYRPEWLPDTTEGSSDGHPPPLSAESPP